MYAKNGKFTSVIDISDSEMYQQNKNAFARVVLHELVHAASALALEEQPELYKAIFKTIKYCRRNIEAKRGHVDWNSLTGDTLYGLKNPHEFMTMFMTSQKFQDMLKFTPAMD